MHLILRCLNALIALVRCQLSQTVHAKAIDANMLLSGRKPGQFMTLENPTISYQQWLAQSEPKLHNFSIEKAADLSSLKQF